MNLFSDLRTLSPEASLPAIDALRQDFAEALLAPNLEVLRLALSGAPDLIADQIVLDEANVKFSRNEPLSEIQRAALTSSLETFRPWKKGPFDFFGIEIDSEWRSNLKWERLKPRLPPLADKVIADIGCHNGYFMFRMAPQQPKAVIGFEPVPKHWYAFQLIQKYARQPHLHFEGLGVEHVHLFPQTFDVVFCLGILYHHTDPVGLLRKIRDSMTTGASLVIDCQGIAGTDPVALTPRARYAGASGIWFLPTTSCLENWVCRAGFRDYELIFAEPLAVEEQRSTAWADIKSLKDFLDPTDKRRTIEGHPAPHRFYALAKR